MKRYGLRFPAAGGFSLGLALAVAAGAAPLSAQIGQPVAGDAAPSSPTAAPQVRGLSGKLRAAIVGALDALDLPYLSSLLGDTGAEPARFRWVSLFGEAAQRPAAGPAAPRVLGEPVSPVSFGDLVAASALRSPQRPGIWRLEPDRSYASAREARLAELSFITRVPFSQKKGSHLNGYHIGRYPLEGTGRTDEYAPPEGFIEVTPENQDFQVSEHFRLRQFLTKDQRNVWPKYLALDLKLIDKLELVLQELNAMGVRADRMHVMSGYRTPQYNGPGGNGRAKLSRHTYGDAADVWVDNDGDEYMDDLNGDGRADLGDAEVMLRAVDRVEAKYPELVGGAGIYVATSAHGPFIHIDTRGQRSRW